MITLHISITCLLWVIGILWGVIGGVYGLAYVGANACMSVVEVVIVMVLTGPLGWLCIVLWPICAAIDWVLNRA